MQAAARIERIYRYPVKGLSAEGLSSTRLRVGRTLLADRLYAIENGPSGFDPAAPAYFPKQRFLMLMRNERLARLNARLDEDTHVLSIELDGAIAARGSLREPEGRAAVEGFLVDFCADELRGPPKVLYGNGHSFSDVARKVVSIISLASLAEIERALGATVDPLRFRANLYVGGWPAWHELALVGHELRIGPTAKLKGVKRIQRCAATEVDPVTAARDLPIPKTLLRTFGHADCGLYAEVIADGEIAVGDAVEEN